MGSIYAIGVSSGDVDAAIAEAVIYDVRVNDLGIKGFPKDEYRAFEQIYVRNQP